jgi:hypothetical protein
MSADEDFFVVASYGTAPTFGGGFRSPARVEERVGMGTGASLSAPAFRLSIEGDAIALELPRDRHVLTPDEARKLGERLVGMADLVAPQKLTRAT